MSAEQTPDIAAVLAEHWEFDVVDGFYTCDCSRVLGEVRVTPADEVDPRHRAHVAAALAPVLDAAVREAEKRAWEVAAQRRKEARRYYVAWQVARMRARAYRADRITEPVSHEAATSGEEASKA